MKYSLDKYQLCEVSHEHLIVWFPETDIYVRIVIPGVRTLGKDELAGQIRDAVRNMLIQPRELPNGRTLRAEDFGL